MKEGRTYRMGARAEAAAATGERILDATVELFWEGPSDQIALAEVARRAGVTVQTVIRRFGTKDGLLAAAVARESARVRDQRGEAIGQDLAGVVEVLLTHYDEHGARSLRLEAEAGRVPGLAPVLDQAREVHREWCATVFADAVTAGGPVRLAQLVAVCDVHVWDVLARQGLDREAIAEALGELLAPLAGLPPAGLRR